jgi:hypothetical protein
MNRQTARRSASATRRSLELTVVSLLIAAVGLVAIDPGPAGAASLPSNCRGSAVGPHLSRRVVHDHGALLVDIVPLHRR